MIDSRLKPAGTLKVSKSLYGAELACPAAQIGEKLSAENEANLDKQQR